MSLPVRWFLLWARSSAATCSGIIAKIVSGIAVTGALLGASAPAAEWESSPPPLQPQANWSGPYIGVALGARYNAVDGNVLSATVGTPPTAISLPPQSPGYNNSLMWWGTQPGAMQYLDHIALGARIYAGWNFQVAPTYVVGLEGDFQLRQ